MFLSGRAISDLGKSAYAGINHDEDVVPLSAPPELPPLLFRPVGVPHRHLDAERGPGVARLGPDPFLLYARRGLGAPVPAHAVPLVLCRALHRLFLETQD